MLQCGLKSAFYRAVSNLQQRISAVSRGWSTVDLFASLSYQTRDKRNVIYTACVSKTKGSATFTMSHAIRLTFPQEQQEEEIKRGREEQRNANQMRREQMRKEAEQAHEQTSSQALHKPESKEGPK